MNRVGAYIQSHNVLVINLADNTINCFISRLVVHIEQAICVAVEAFHCHLLLVSSWNHLETQIQCLSKAVKESKASPVSLRPTSDQSLLKRMQRIHFVKVSPAQVPMQPPFVYCKPPSWA